MNYGLGTAPAGRHYFHVLVARTPGKSAFALFSPKAAVRATPPGDRQSSCFSQPKGLPAPRLTCCAHSVRLAT